MTPKQLEAVRNRAGAHTGDGGRDPFSEALGIGEMGTAPADPEQRLYYGLLEILDFDCIGYGDAPEGLSEESIGSYLIEHRDKITCGPSSALGALAGVFEFLDTPPPTC